MEFTDQEWLGIGINDRQLLINYRSAIAQITGAMQVPSITMTEIDQLVIKLKEAVKGRQTLARSLTKQINKEASEDLRKQIDIMQEELSLMDKLKLE